MSEQGRDQRPADGRLSALVIASVLAVASVMIAALGASPARVSVQEALGDPRMPGEQAFIASHRGAVRDAPENTLPAIEAALDAGFDYVEVDVVLTADGHAVLMHDPTVDRTTDGRGRVDRLTLEQIRGLDAGVSHALAFTGTPVPTLGEALDVVAAKGGRAVLDLKGAWTAEAAADLVREVRVRGLESAVIVAAFDARTLALVAACSEVITRMVTLRRVPADLVDAVVQIGARGVIVEHRELVRHPEIVEQLHAAGLRVAVYTPNSDRHWRAITALGVDGIVTDDPAMLRAWQSSSLASG